MTDTEAVEARTERLRSERDAWKARAERAEAANQAMREPMRLLREAMAMPAQGEAYVVASLLTRLRQAEQERDEWTAKAESIWRVKEDNERFAVEQERAAAEALRERDAARRETVMAVEAAHDADARAQVAEQARDEARRLLSVQHEAAGCTAMHTALRAEHSCTLERLHASTAAREEGRRAGLEQAERLAYAVDSISRMRDSIHEALAAQPAQEASRQDGQCPGCVMCCANEQQACPNDRPTAPATLQESGTVERQDTAALFATVRALLGHVVKDGREEAESALSALERRMGAMVLALQGLVTLARKEQARAPSGAVAGAWHEVRLRCERDLRFSPPVFTLEEVESVAMDVCSESEDMHTDDARRITKRLRERAGGKA